MVNEAVKRLNETSSKISQGQIQEYSPSPKSLTQQPSLFKGSQNMSQNMSPFKKPSKYEEEFRKRIFTENRIPKMVVDSAVR